MNIYKTYGFQGDSREEINFKKPNGGLIVESGNPDKQLYVCEDSGNGINGSWVLRENFSDLSNATFAMRENEWAEKELIWADKEVKKHNDNHSRAKSTPAALSAYRNALRDHVINSVVQGVRPTRPY